MSIKPIMKNRILLLGTVASGKTLLARRLGVSLSIPIVHVDQIEFNKDLTKRPAQTVRDEIKQALDSQSWILDGHGPLDLLPEHLKKSELILFLDFPLWLNIYFLIKRQLGILFHPRQEMPKGANEWNWPHFRKLFQTLLKQRRLMNPELIRILNKPENKNKVVHIKSLKMWNELYHNPKGRLDF